MSVFHEVNFVTVDHQVVLKLDGKLIKGVRSFNLSSCDSENVSKLSLELFVKAKPDSQVNT
jgi:hypothetical protein